MTDGTLNLEFTNINHPFAISAIAIEALGSTPTYTLTTTSSAGGTVSPTGGTYDSGTPVTLTATPETGYTFVGWTGDLTSFDNPLNLMVWEDISLDANFVLTENIGETVVAINCGGAAYLSLVDGVGYVADTYFDGGTAASSFTEDANYGGDILGTVDDGVYQSYRKTGYAGGSSHSYNIPLDKGTYSVTLKFADYQQWQSNDGDLILEGEQVLSNYNVQTEAGAPFTAHDLNFIVRIDDGELNMQFINTVDNVGDFFINAIRVDPLETLEVSANTSWSSLDVTGIDEVYVSSGVLTVDAAASISQIRAAASAGLSVASGQTLTVDYLILESDATLLGAANLTVNKATIVQRSLSVGVWQYLTPPVTGATANDVEITTADQYAYIASYDNTVSGSGAELGNGWSYLTQDTDALTAGKGYAVQVTEAKTIEFSGSLITSEQSISGISTGDAGNPWVFIGNPFAAHLDWTAIANDNDIAGGVAYIYDPDFPGGNEYGSVNIDGTILNQVGSKYIPAMQGFFVSATGSGDGALTIPTTALSHQSQGFYKSETVLRNFVRMAIVKDDYADEAVLYFKENGENNYNAANDGLKFEMADGTNPLLYTQTDGRNLSYNILGELPASIPVAVYSPVAETLTLRFSELKNLDENLTVVLEDQLSGMSYDVTKQNELVFDAVAGETADRFVLHFDAQVAASINGMDVLNASVFFNGNKLVVEKSTSGNARLYLFNVGGQRLFNTEVSGMRSEVEPNLPAGIYLVKITAPGGTYSRKVVKK